MLCVSAVDNIAAKYIYAYGHKRMGRLQCSDLYSDFWNGLEGREEVQRTHYILDLTTAPCMHLEVTHMKAVDIQAQLSSVE